MPTTAKLIKTSKFLLYSTAALPFILSGGFSFPYVTVRTALFRMIIEVVSIILIWFYWQGKVSKRDWKKSYLLLAFALLLAVEFMAAIFGASWQISIFSDLERMWGIFTVAHLLVFFGLLRVWFSEKDWVYFFRVSLVTSLLVSLYGIIQHFPDMFGIYVFEAGAGRIPSTLGNPTYVAMYLLFNLAFAAYFLKKDKSSWRYFYWLSLAINLYTLTLTDIRGAYLGLIAGIALSAFLYLWLGTVKLYRIAAGTMIALFVVAGIFIFAIHGSVRAAKIPIVSRLATISLSDSSVQTRFIGWNAAWQGFKERPLLGVGMENYNLVFNKYFPARYYNLAPTETYFDRSHNHYLNLLAESGLGALLLYLLLPLIAGFYLWRGYRSARLTLPELSIFSALLVAYLVHIFFVFEEINTALFFAALLAFIEHRYYQGNIIVIAEKQRALPGAKILAILGIIVLGVSIYNFNWKILRVARVNAAAYLAEDISQKIDYYNQSLAMDVVSSRNIVAGYADFLVSLADGVGEIKKDVKLSRQYPEALSAVEAALGVEFQKKPNDVFLLLKLAQVKNADYLFSNDMADIKDAIANLKQAIALSPGRLQLYYVLGESYVIAKEPAAAIDILQKAVDLNPAFGASYYYLGRAYLTADDLDKGYDSIINKAIGENHYVPENNIVLSALGEALAAKGRYGQVAPVYEAVIRRETDKKIKAQFLAALAAAYVQVSDKDKAIESARQAAELDQSFGEEANYFINMIQSGKIEELKKSTR